MDPTPASLLVWTPSLAVGVREIDQQHEELFGRTREVTGLLGATAESRSLATPVDELVAFTGLHFGTEHALMRRHAFPDAELHDEQHTELLDQLRRFAANLLEGLHPPEALKAVRFLASWLTQHIAHSDRELATWLRGRGVD